MASRVLELIRSDEKLGNYCTYTQPVRTQQVLEEREALSKLTAATDESRLARIFWHIFPLGRQLAVLGRQLDFRGSISPPKIKISTIHSTNLLFRVEIMC